MEQPRDWREARDLWQSVKSFHGFLMSSFENSNRKYDFTAEFQVKVWTCESGTARPLNPHCSFSICGLVWIRLNLQSLISIVWIHKDSGWISFLLLVVCSTTFQTFCWIQVWDWGGHRRSLSWDLKHYPAGSSFWKMVNVTTCLHFHPLSPTRGGGGGGGGSRSHSYSRLTNHQSVSVVNQCCLSSNN